MTMVRKHGTCRQTKQKEKKHGTTKIESDIPEWHIEHSWEVLASLQWYDVSW